VRALTWFAVLGAPTAWALQHVTGFALTVAGCGEGGGGVAIDGVTIALTAVAATVAVLAEVAAFVVFRATRTELDGDPPQARVYFMSIVGLTINPLFFAIIVLSGVGVAVLENCRTS
jgi:hypothetical protein